MNIRFLIEEEEIRGAFPLIRPFLARLPQVADYVLDDLEQLALKRKLYFGMVKQAGIIKMVIAFEFIAYPRLLAVNIIALAGEALEKVIGLFFETFCDWCRQAGAQAIEARCGEAMTRLLRRYGLGKVYNVVRMDLESR